MLKSYLIKGAAFVLLCLLLIAGKVFYMQRSHYLQAEQYFETDLKLAILEYDAAMHNYIPWSPYIQKSAERLWQIGEMLEQKGNPGLAVIAYTSLRSSFYASRSLYTPGREWIEKCDDKIASLNVNALVNEGTIKPESGEEEKNKHLFVMKTDKAPSSLWSVILEFAFFGWIASVVFIIVKGMDKNGNWKKRTAVFGIALFIMSFTVWIIASLNA